MTSAENSISGASKFENFGGEDTPDPTTRPRAFGTRDNAPSYKKT